MRALRAVLALLVLMAAACGGGDPSTDTTGLDGDNGSIDSGTSDTTTPGPGTTAASGTGSVDGCVLLTEDDAEMILGKPVEFHPSVNEEADEFWCDWIAADFEGVRIIVVVGPRAQEEWQFSQMFYTQAEEVALGDGALYADGDPKMLRVVSGNVHFTLMLFLAGDTSLADPRAVLVEQARRVIDRL